MKGLFGGAADEPSTAWSPSIEEEASIRDAAGMFADRSGDHEGVSAATVAAWIHQFQTDWPIAVKLLEHTVYYSTSQIRTMTRELLLLAKDDLSQKSAQSVAVAAIGDSGSGSSIIARALRDHVKKMSGFKYVSLLDLATLSGPSPYDAIILFDDFSGTGDTIADWWTNTGEPILLQHGARVSVAVLVMNHRAKPKVDPLVDSVLYVDHLGPDRDVFQSDCTTFDTAEKQRIEDCCLRTGCSGKFVRGYGDCGLLLAFKHQCPNNSLPVLWHKKNAWRNLFRRSGL